MPIPQEINKHLEHIIKCARETMPVTAIYLFGYYASGKYHPNSDIDIYIVTSDRSKRLLDWAIAVDKKIGMPRTISIDIIVNYDDDFIRKSEQFFSIEQQILQKGVRLYAKQ